MHHLLQAVSSVLVFYGVFPLAFNRLLFKLVIVVGCVGLLASQSNNSTRVSLSAFGPHEAGSAKPSALSKYIDSFLGVIDNDLAYPEDPTAPFQSALATPSVPHQLGCAVTQGELQYA